MISERQIPDLHRLTASSWLDEILIRICVALQLTRTQHSEAESHYLAVSRWLTADGSSLARFQQSIYPQGSLRIGTTVRPWGREEYDLDLVLELSLGELEFADPIGLLDALERRLRTHGVYAPLVERKNRCIRLKFAHQFHLDVLPARTNDKLGGTCILVPDCAVRGWKHSNPKGYAGWFENAGTRELEYKELRAASVEPIPLPEEAQDKNALQLAVQLMKRRRDLAFSDRQDLAPISIVLTTLAGTFFNGETNPLAALSAIVRSINAAIPSTGRLVVCNPANPLEDLSERWDRDPEAYDAFVRSMRLFEAELSQLELESGIPNATAALERIFGEELARAAVVRHARDVELIRQSRSLRVSKSGLLTPASAAPAVVIRSNNFYGGR